MQIISSPVAGRGMFAPKIQHFEEGILKYETWGCNFEKAPNI